MNSAYEVHYCIQINDLDQVAKTYKDEISKFLVEVVLFSLQLFNPEMKEVNECLKYFKAT